jgi:hypothetical protein
LRRTLLRPVGGTRERRSLDRPKHHASSNDWQAGELVRLPAPKGAFMLFLRLYWPTDTSPSILNGSWKVPQVAKVN